MTIIPMPSGLTAYIEEEGIEYPAVGFEQTDDGLVLLVFDPRLGKAFRVDEWGDDDEIPDISWEWRS